MWTRWVLLLQVSVALLCMVAIGGCTFIPNSGPLATEVERQAGSETKNLVDFRIVELTPQVTSVLHTYRPIGFYTKFSGDRWIPPRHIVGVGDVVSVVVWEPGGEGLFTSPTTGGKTELGPFVVGQSGAITVPYIGKVHARGKSVEQLQTAIRIALEPLANDPQVIVAIQQNFSNMVAVNGDVRAPGRYPLSIKGERLLDVIAKAGGAAASASETKVTLVRGSSRGTQLLRNVFERPDENVFVRTDDQVYLTHDPPSFTAFGAVQRIGEYPMRANEVTLAEALGRAGGIADTQANAAGVFLFRYEDPRMVARFDPTVTLDYKNRAPIPVIYRIHMRRAQAYFLTQSVVMRDKDVIYIANAAGRELGKFIGILNSTLLISQPPLSLAGSVSVLTGGN